MSDAIWLLILGIGCVFSVVLAFRLWQFQELVVKLLFSVVGCFACFFVLFVCCVLTTGWGKGYYTGQSYGKIVQIQRGDDVQFILLQLSPSENEWYTIPPSLKIDYLETNMGRNVQITYDGYVFHRWGRRKEVVSLSVE